MNHFRSAESGFTLLGLITALSIAVITITSVVPGLRTQISNYRLTTSGNHLLGSILLARSEAIKSNRRVTVASVQNGWTQGWIVYVDENDNGHREKDEPLLQDNGQLNGGLTLQGNRPVKSYISYVGSGQSQRVTGSMQMGTLMLCDNTTNFARAIIISSSGRPRISNQPEDFNQCST